MNSIEFDEEFNKIVLQGRIEILRIFEHEIKMIKPIGEYLDTNTPVSYLGGVNSETRDELVKLVEEGFPKQSKHHRYLTSTTELALSEAVRRCFTPFCYDVRICEMNFRELLEIENVAEKIIDAVGSLEPIEKEIIHQLLRQKDDVTMSNES